MSLIENLKQQILKLSKSNGYNIQKIDNAIKLSEDLHKDQKRKSGEPYFIHPLEVAFEIINLNLGEEAVIAALLHDTLEDCEITKAELELQFGSQIADLVEGVTKVAQITNNSLNRYSELDSLRKFIIASSRDIRVLLIKLADRLHNMKTISALKPERQISYSDETLKVYVPLAEFIGVGKWKRELEDIAFHRQNPEIYSQIENLIQKDSNSHQKIIDEIIKNIKKILDDNKISYSNVYGRIKSISSLYQKILKKTKGKNLEIKDFDISQIKDLLGISIIINEEIIECYKTLGVIHGNFDFSEKDFSDYIAKPKTNGYRAIHTIIFHENRSCEIQIKTNQMHEVNEFGPASHISYKLSGKKIASTSSKFDWVKSLNLWKKDDINEDSYNLNLFENSIFSITPKGRVIELEKDSTPIDFAYSIHSSVGNRYIGAKVNSNLVHLDYKIKNGDIVEILTSKQEKKPPIEWINHAKQNSTKNKIKKYSIQFELDLTIDKGKKEISDYLQEKIKLDWFAIDSSILNKLFEKFHSKNIDDFYIRISRNILSKKNILQSLIEDLNLKFEDSISQDQEKPNSNLPISSNKKISFEGIDGLEYKIAGCCNPKFQENIIGIVTLRDGLKIHKKNCKMLADYDSNRILNARWN